MRVVICADDPLRLGALSATIARAGHTVEAGTLTPWDAVAAVHLHEAELLLIDLVLPDANGLEAARQVVATDPCTRVVVLSGSCALQPFQEALELGVAGYLRNDQPFDRIIDAIEGCGRGERVLDAALLRLLSDTRELPPRRATAEEPTVRTTVQGFLSSVRVDSRREAVPILAERGPLGHERPSGCEGREGQWSRRPC